MKNYCDLVMKGGITSGVIYPKLISRLSSQYHFKNIGGTSAGAIAAGACAAAEYGRGHGNPTAFESLVRLPEDLSEKITKEGRTRLFTLFQPTPSLRPHFSVLMRALNAETASGAVSIVTGMLALRKRLVFMALVIGALLLWPSVESISASASHLPGLLAAGCTMLIVAVGLLFTARSAARGQRRRALLGLVAMPVATGAVIAWATGSGLTLELAGVAVGLSVVALLVLAVLLIAVALLFARDLARGMHANGYGMCSGLTPNDGKPDVPALTDWLHGYLNGLAGTPSSGQPLTFSQLWGTTDETAAREINLEVMTSAVSQQMVYSVPFRPGTPRFYYDPQEWSRLFPTAVMQWLAAAQPGSSEEGLPQGSVVASRDGRLLRPLPSRGDLPVVVAVRMSLSFPLLLSAVPLYSIDWSRKDNIKRKADLGKLSPDDRAKSPLVATRVWFSDGGIGSNMPLHMFDALLPGHPTFAANLKTEHPDFAIAVPERADNDGGRIYLPEDNRAGQLRHWREPADGQPLGGLVGFVKAIVNTMQNWRDEILFPYPGYRDRIVQISQRTNEGGLNLDMPDSSITALAGAGEMAADRLIARFHPAGQQSGAGWSNHRSVRLGTFLGTMQPGASALGPSLGTGAWTSLVTSIKDYGPAERTLATQFLQGLGQLAALGQGQSPALSLVSGALKPVAQIRVTPRI